MLIAGQDVGSAVAKLDAVLIACVLLVLIFICLLIFNRNNTIASLVPMATIVLGFSFIFGHSAQTLFESVSIFIYTLYVAHGLISTAYLHFLYPCIRCWGPGHDR